MFMEKRKRKRSEPRPTLRIPLLLSGCILGLSATVMLAALFHFEPFFEVYATIAGIMMTFFWPIIAFCGFLLLLRNQYRGYAAPRKAQVVMLVLVAIALLWIGTMSVVVNGFA